MNKKPPTRKTKAGDGEATPPHAAQHWQGVAQSHASLTALALSFESYWRGVQEHGLAKEPGLPVAVNNPAPPAVTPFPLLRRTSPKGPVIAGERQMGRENTALMRAQMHRELLQLDHYADGGDVEAAELLATVANAAIQMLRVLAERQPDLLRPFARKCLVWPDMISRHPGAGKRNKWILDELQVGAESPERGGWHETSPATQQALFLLEWLRTNQLPLELPPMTHKTRAHWFKIGWSFILVATNGKPEKDEFLAPIGQYRAKHSEQEGHQKRVTKLTGEQNVRDGIRSKLWQSFQSLTKFAPASP